MNVNDAEICLEAKVEAIGLDGGYDAFLDFNVGFWVSSLDPFLARFLAAIARQWSSDPPCQATQRVRLGLGSSSALRGHHGLVAPLSPINKRESRGDRGPL